MYTVENNMKLVGFAIKKYFNKGHDFEDLGLTKDDLFQIGCIGLIKAVDKFDESLGFAFSTFAVKYITGEIFRELTNKSSMLRFPKDVKAISREILKNEFNYNLSEIMEKYDVTTYKANLVLECIKNHNVKSLDELILDDESGNDVALIDLIPSKDDFMLYDLKDELEDRLSILNKREREIILLALEKNNQAHIAKQLGLSQVTISRYLRTSIEKINNSFEPVGVRS